MSHLSSVWHSYLFYLQISWFSTWPHQLTCSHVPVESYILPQTRVSIFFSRMFSDHFQSARYWQSDPFGRISWKEYFRSINIGTISKFSKAKSNSIVYIDWSHRCILYRTHWLIIDYSNDFSGEMHLESLKIIFRLSQILVGQIE